MQQSSAVCASPLDAHTERLVAMLGVIASQIEAALHETNAPAATLVETAHAMSKATELLAKCVFDFSGAPVRVFQDLMVLHDDMHGRAVKAATAVQFHDRLVQCLTHVCSSLSHLAGFIASAQGPKSLAEWDELGSRVRGMHSMEQERILFDLLSRGAAPDERRTALATQRDKGAANVELF